MTRPQSRLLSDPPTKTCPRCEGTGQVPDPVYIGAQMRRLRGKTGMSLREMARRAGFSAPYISDAELGRRTWSRRLLAAYEDVLRKEMKG